MGAAPLLPYYLRMNNKTLLRTNDNPPGHSSFPVAINDERMSMIDTPLSQFIGQALLILDYSPGEFRDNLMDQQNNGFNSHWAQDAPPNNDYLNLMPDFEQLEASNPSILPTEWPASQGNEDYDYQPYVSDNYLEQGNFQQPSAQAQTQRSQLAPSGFSNAHRGHTLSGYMNEDSATLMRNRLTKWHLDSQKDAMPRLSGADDNDSCKLSCDEDTCPSHCGETGQGAVCCDDNDCGASSLCVDEDCDGANHPCTDENCLSDASPQRVVGPGENRDKELEEEDEGEEEEEEGREAVAAAALSSIGDMAEHQLGDSQANTGRLNTASDFHTGSPSHGSSFQNTPSPPFSTTQGSMFTNTQTSPFPNQFGTSYLSQQGFNTSVTGLGFNANIGTSSDGQNNWFLENNAWQTNPAFSLASHMFQYHAPGSGTDHTGPCPVDTSNLSFSTCPLPLLSHSHGFGDQMDLDPLATCGFTFQDTEMFQEHVFSQHRDLMRSFPTMGSGNTFDVSQGPQNGFESFFTGQQMNSSHSTGGNLPNEAQSMNMAFPSGSHQQTFEPAAITTVKAATKTKSKTKPKAIAKAKPKQRNKPLPTKSQDSEAEADEEVEGLFGTIDGKQAPDEYPTLTLKDGTVLKPLPADQLVQPEKPAVCFWNDPKAGGICGQWFQSAEALDIHCREHHIDPMGKIDGGFVCNWDQCSRKDKPPFGQKGKLVRHIQTHTAYKPFVCPYCAEPMSAKQALDQHVRCHTLEEPFPCDWPGCNHAFKQKSALTMHYRTHTGEKPLRCEICHLTFRESSNLTKHRRTHSAKGRYECEICRRHFHRLDQLRRHLNTNHKDNPEQLSQAIGRLRPASRHAAQGRRGVSGNARSTNSHSHGTDEASSVEFEVKTPLSATESGNAQRSEGDVVATDSDRLSPFDKGTFFTEFS